MQHNFSASCLFKIIHIHVDTSYVLNRRNTNDVANFVLDDLYTFYYTKSVDLASHHNIHFFCPEMVM